MPKYFLLGVITLLFIILTVLIIKQDSAKFYKIFFTILPILSSVILIAVLFSPQFVTRPWQTPRSMYMMYGVLSFFILTLLLFLKKKSNFYNKIVLVILFTFILVSAFNINKMAASTLAQNQANRIEAIQLVNTIQRYEAENNVIVSKIFFLQENPTWSTITIPLFNPMFDYNLRAMLIGWNRLNAIRFYTGRKFEKSTEEIETVKEKIHFTGKPYYILHEVIIQDDTAYVAVY